MLRSMLPSGPASHRTLSRCIAFPNAFKGASWFALLMMTLYMSLDLSSQTATSILSGTVTDESGAVVQGVTMTVRNSGTGTTRSGKTDDAGRYSFPNLDPGEYQLRAEAPNYRPALHSGVILRVGGLSNLDVILRVGAVSEVVEIREETPIIETAKIDISRVIDSRDIANTPNIGRNFVDFVKLSSEVAPGRENVGGGPFKEPDIGVGSSAAPRLSFAGQSELNTMIQVDGATNIQTVTGLPRATPSQEAVREFRILNSTYPAEY